MNSVALTLTLTMTGFLPEVKGGGYLQEQNTYANTFNGHMCLDVPVSAACGWRIDVTSDPALGRIVCYEATVTQSNGGKQFTIVNEHWNGGTPQAGQEFCVEVQISGAFGNAMPTYVNIDWGCICTSSTCDPVPSSATTTTTTPTTTTTTPTTTTTIPTTTTPITTTTPAATTNMPMPEIRTAFGNPSGLYAKHTDLCHVGPTSSSGDVPQTHSLLCFQQCVVMEDACYGVNVFRDDVTGGSLCSYVTSSSLVTSASASCTFWQKV